MPPQRLDGLAEESQLGGQGPGSAGCRSIAFRAACRENHCLGKGREASPDGSNSVGRQAGKRRGRRVEQRREGDPRRHVVVGIAFGLERLGADGGHHEQPAAVVVERLGEHGNAVGEPPRGPTGRAGQALGPGRDRRHGRLQGRELRLGGGGLEPRRLAKRFGQIEKRGVDILAGGISLGHGELASDLTPGPGSLLEELNEPGAADRVRGCPERKLPPVDIGPPQLIDLGVGGFQPELPAIGPRRPPPVVEFHEPLPQGLAVGHVGGRGVFEPAVLAARGIEDGQLQQLAHLLVLRDQEWNVLPGLRSHEPVEQQFVGLPADEGSAGPGGELRRLGVRDRLDMSPGERVERHDPPVLEHGYLPPRGERRMQPRRWPLRRCDDGGGHDHRGEEQRAGRAAPGKTDHHAPPGWRRGAKK